MKLRPIYPQLYCVYTTSPLFLSCAYTDVQAHSAKLTQNPFALRTPGLLGNVPERHAKPNRYVSEMVEENMAALKLNGREQIAKRNLAPSLRAPKSVKESFDIPRPEDGTTFSVALCPMIKMTTNQLIK